MKVPKAPKTLCFVARTMRLVDGWLFLLLVAPAHADHGDLMVFLKALLRDRDLAAPCVEIKFRAPHAIDAMSSPWLRLLDGVEFPGHRRDIVAVTASVR